MADKTNYQITIGYFAIITVNVTAENEDDAKQIGVAELEKQKAKMYKTGHLELQDDNYKADGCVDMDRTWNQI